MDDIGLGRAMANVLYLSILFLTVVGASLFLSARKKIFAFWWVSLMGNIFAFLNFLGDSHLIAYIIRLFSILVWPFINIGLLIYLIARERGQSKKDREAGQAPKKELKKTVIILATIVLTTVLVLFVGFYLFIRWLVSGA